MTPDSEIRPRLRGVSHQVAAVFAAVFGTALVAFAPSARAAFAGGVFGSSLLAQFSISALYHRRDWGPVAYGWLHRLDHACIFVLIAGTYTPFCLLAMPGHSGLTLLALAWTIAIAGIAQAIFWVEAPRKLVASFYVLFGWIALPWFTEVRDGLGPQALGLIALGGVLYSIGAVVYALKRPDPIPKVFGYHEVFHALVILASICHFAVVAALVHPI